MTHNKTAKTLTKIKMITKNIKVKTIIISPLNENNTDTKVFFKITMSV